jgi:hypothetical protein
LSFSQPGSQLQQQLLLHPRDQQLDQLLVRLAAPHPPAPHPPPPPRPPPPPPPPPPALLGMTLGVIGEVLLGAGLVMIGLACACCHQHSRKLKVSYEPDGTEGMLLAGTRFRSDDFRSDDLESPSLTLPSPARLRAHSLTSGLTSARAFVRVPVRIAEAFDRFDTDHSGYIDRRELRAVLHHYGVDLSEHGVLAVLARYDAEPNGLMDLREFSELVRDLEEGKVRAEPVRPAALPPPPVPAPASPATRTMPVTQPPPPAPASPTSALAAAPAALPTPSSPLVVIYGVPPASPMPPTSPTPMPSQPPAAPPTAATRTSACSSGMYEAGYEAGLAASIHLGPSPPTPMSTAPTPTTAPTPSTHFVEGFFGTPSGQAPDSARVHAHARLGLIQAPQQLAGGVQSPVTSPARPEAVDPRSAAEMFASWEQDSGDRVRRPTMSEKIRRASGHGELRLSAEYERAAKALRAEGKELLGVLTQLKLRCGPSTLSFKPGTNGHRVGIRLNFARSPDAGDRTALIRLANIAGLRNPIIEPAVGGVRVTFIEDYPPPLHDLPARLHAHAHALGEALHGHHERAINLFLLVAEHFMGVPTHQAVERKLPLAYYDLPARVTGEHDPAPVYPEVPPLMMAAGYSATEAPADALQSI